MKVWLLTTGEPLPIDDNSPRLLRTGIFANQLTQAGHNVTWWSATFDHYAKKHRYNVTINQQLASNYKLILLHSKGYRHNISIDRIIDHKQVAEEFTLLSKKEEKPDIIVSSYPTPDLCMAAIQYGKENNVPIIVDVRDLWPEVFVDVAPKMAKPIAQLILKPLFNKANKIFKNATGIVALTKGFLDISLEKSKRKQQSVDGVFPLGYVKPEIQVGEITKAKEFWQKLGVDTNKFIVCFFGSIGHHSDFDTIIESCQSLNKCNVKVQFVICGSGDKTEYYKKMSEDIEGMIFPGFVNKTQIQSLMQMAHAGIIPYLSTLNYQNNITNKAIEYLCGGLPILTGLDGFFGDWVEEQACGFRYQNHHPESLINLIELMIAEPQKRMERSHNALNLYENSFRSDQVYKQYQVYLEKIVQSYHTKLTSIESV
jgi:glycosyltransferase involved in cell wall biosynthesis